MTEAAVSPTGGASPVRATSAQEVLPSRSVMSRLLAHRTFVVGSAIFGVMALAALVVPELTPYDPVRSNFRTRFLEPSWAHLFGTDNFGRDILTRVAYGARTSLLIGLAVVSLTAVMGVLFGAVAGYFRRLDNPVMRVMDALMAFPAVLLAIAITAALQPRVENVILALAVAYTPRTARIVRASVLVVRETEFVHAARLASASHGRVLWRHILPNSMAPLIVQLTFIFAYAVLAEATLSFLGVGPPPPAPTLGNIIAEGRDFVVDAPWITVFPGIAICATVLGLNLLGDGLRDLTDPRLSRKR